MLATCFALAVDLWICKVSPNIRGVGSKVEVLLAWGPGADRGVSVPDGIPEGRSKLKSFVSLLCLGELETLEFAY